MTAASLLTQARSSPAWVCLVPALVVRLLGLFSRPIWYDEAFAILFSRTGPAAMRIGTLSPDALGSAADIHPLAYYTLLWTWMRLFGEAVPIARLLSVLLGLAAIWLAVHLVHAALGERLAWWTGLLLALAPFPVHYAQEIRMYGLLAFALLAATYFHWRALGLFALPARRVDWLLFAIFAALAQYTHNLAVFFLVPLAALPALHRDLRGLRLTVLAAGVAVLLYSPWLVRLPDQLAKVNTSYWTTAPGPDRLVTTLLSFTTNLPVPPQLLPFALLAALLVAALAAWQTLRRVRHGQTDAVWGLRLAYLAAAPPLLMFAVSQWVPVYIERALLPSGIFFVLWAAWALHGTGMPRPARLLTTAIWITGMLVGLTQHLDYAGFPYGPYSEVNAAIRASGAADAVILHTNKLSALPAYLDAPDLPHHYLADPPGSGSDTLAPPTQEVIGFLADSSIEAAVGDARIVWLIVFRQELAEMAGLGYDRHPALAWLDDRYVPVEATEWDDLVVYEFSRP